MLVTTTVKRIFKIYFLEYKVLFLRNSILHSHDESQQYKILDIIALLFNELELSKKNLDSQLPNFYNNLLKFSKYDTLVIKRNMPLPLANCICNNLKNDTQSAQLSVPKNPATTQTTIFPRRGGTTSYLCIPPISISFDRNCSPHFVD